ncbi:MAG: hypothetical protein J5806_15190 [Lentisphaeria bacterium]|nr:hypothetical protein [Lentisphaeria bacterium]
MRKIDQRSRSILLLLLFVGSFVLHPLIHDFGCHSDPVRLSSCGEKVGRTIAPSEHQAEFHAAETFCPVCAGLLTAFCPENDQSTVFSGGTDPVKTPCSGRVSTPDWLKPSPRAPPAA